jgi:hypothetical protein
MSDTTAIQKVLKEDGDSESQPLNAETGEGPVTSKQIMDQMKFIGDKITDVSTKQSISHQAPMMPSFLLNSG